MVQLVSEDYPLSKFIGFIIIYAVGMVGQPAMATKFFSLKNSKLLGSALFLGVISYCFTILNPWQCRLGCLCRHLHPGPSAGPALAPRH